MFYHPTQPLAEAFERGQALRHELPRSGHGRLVIGDRDPVAILEEQNATRLRDLVPVRIGRMLQSPFTYYRGTAAVMAHDLSTDAVSGPRVVSCGDAHISNFGLYASPERRIMFDLNDFDEASVGPWEWDVKRLAASAVIGARDNGFDADECRAAAEAAVRAYRVTLRRLYRMSALDRYFYQVDTDWLERASEGAGRKVLRKAVKKARKRTADQVLEKLVVREDGGPSRIVDQRPIAQHVDHGNRAELEPLFDQYSHSLRSDVRVLMSQFTLVDYILRVVGVGSVGTRCYVLLLEGPNREPLFLQAKEAPPSVLETYGGIPFRLPTGYGDETAHGQGRRVVAAQRVLQAQSDPFLGWIQGFAGEDRDRRPVDYYWRQFRDMKGSIDTAALEVEQFHRYVALCGALLARAHSQSPTGAVVAGYVGSSERLDVSMADWAVAYADQNERDYEALQRAVDTGRLDAEFGV